jgi:peroxiredoxin
MYRFNLCLCFWLWVLCPLSLIAQDDVPSSVPTAAVEKTSLPDLRFFTAADSILFTAAMLGKSKPILFFYFSTKCPYCEALMSDLFKNADKLKDYEVLLVSGHRRVSIQKFLAPYDLSKTHFRVLKDDERRMHSYFDYKAVPMLRLYDKNRELIHRQEGRMEIGTILSLFKNAGALASETISR